MGDTRMFAPGHRPALRATAALFAAVVIACCCAGQAQAGLIEAAGAPSLTDDAGRQPLFSGVTPISPGTPDQACIAITASGALTGDRVTFRAQDVTGALADSLAMRVEIGSGGGYGDCSGFVGTEVFAGSLSALVAGGDGVETGWEPARVRRQVFRISAGLDSSAPRFGLQAGATFTWTLLAGPLEASPSPLPTSEPSSDPAVTDPAVTDPAVTPPAADPETGATSSPVPDAGGSAAPSRPRATLEVPGTGSRTSVPESRGWDAMQQQFGRTLERAKDETLQAISQVVAEPGFTLGPLLVAGLFLLTQHLIDLRDPKLAAASRTQRDLTLEFRREYQPNWEDLP